MICPDETIDLFTIVPKDQYLHGTVPMEPLRFLPSPNERTISIRNMSSDSCTFMGVLLVRNHLSDICEKENLEKKKKSTMQDVDGYAGRTNERSQSTRIPSIIMRISFLTVHVCIINFFSKTTKRGQISSQRYEFVIPVSAQSSKIDVFILLFIYYLFIPSLFSLEVEQQRKVFVLSIH
jgi:hypothetical protein